MIGPSSRALVVFARAPEPGRVKTRLAADLGEEAALEIYRDLGRRVVDAVASLDDCRTVIAYTPADRLPAMRDWLGDGLAYEPQPPGDLGRRMAEAIAARTAAGADRVVVIGTDCPDADARTVEDAFRRLDAADLVLGPANDGGYYLIGMRRLHRAVFQGVPWSSPDTLRATIERARALGLEIALLDEKTDIDTLEDWRAWRARTGDQP